jgi:hypothetical protein
VLQEAELSGPLAILAKQRLIAPNTIPSGQQSKTQVKWFKSSGLAPNPPETLKG